MKRKLIMENIERYTLKKGTKPTKKQIEEIRAAVSKPHTYDEECPPFTKEDLKQFKRVGDARKEESLSNRKQNITLRLKPQTIARAKSLGKGYTSILSQLIENALADPDKLKMLL